jgi:hypothetical protein
MLGNPVFLKDFENIISMEIVFPEFPNKPTPKIQARNQGKKLTKGNF